MKFITSLEDWFTHSLWPQVSSFLKGAAQSEVAAVAPIAEQAIANLTVQETAALASGNTANTGHILAAVVRNTTAAAEVAGIKAGANSILVAVGAKLPPTS